MLKLLNISASYQDIPILENIYLNISSKLFYGIIGPNGAGKTTLLKIMTGIKGPDAGEVLLQGKKINRFAKKEVAKIMAVVPQSSFVPPLFTVEDVVSMGRYPFQQLRFSDSDADRRCVDEAMEKTGINGLRHRRINELSGGQRQEVIIARALAQTPQILMLDEPTANLDIKHQMKILHLTSALVRNEGMAAVMVIHDLNLAARFCDRLILLHDKKILTMGTPETVLTPAHLKTAYGVETSVGENPLTRSLEVTVLDKKGAVHESVKQCVNY
ncbi:iron complex transport system ATP-binding protein [Desulfocicer vacuolatum DSM 3385]|uniref:Iron complex transport system ATP-binding protein n=1 Tax=Desulfocicer vacuolatum DSM 3385 TaxID=1121400 RepID=A0A1W2DEG3_9BACT|nr:ABC transporter ATP-binding protein [Desulfocicer vacuolatum]SMC95446.1 iron complex transport system ATP-binding protein [Desulfocicer vacuolatum DSM 3385]